MAYDERLAQRVRDALAGESDVTERGMFGGIAFMLSGHMTVTVSGRGGLMVRTGPDGEDGALAQPHTSVMMMRGRPMTGWIRVGADGLTTEHAVAKWTHQAVKFVRTLPPKS
jgi:hypothetical protein